MGSLITSKTHRYLSVRLQPSDYIIKKFHENDDNAIQLMWDYGKKQVKFKDDLYEYLIKKTVKQSRAKYMFFREECVEEEIREVTGIRLCRAEHYLILCIPKNEMTDKYFEEIPKLTDLKTKELKKTRGSYSDYGVSTYWRNESKKSMEEFIKKNPDLKEHYEKIFGSSEKK